jgi:hypothetical protein
LTPKINPHSQQISNNSIKKEALRTALACLSLNTDSKENTPRRRAYQANAVTSVLHPPIDPKQQAEDMVKSIFVDSENNDSKAIGTAQVNNVFDRLTLGAIVAAEKYRTWTPPRHKELTLTPKLNEASLQIMSQRKSRIDYLTPSSEDRQSRKPAVDQGSAEFRKFLRDSSRARSSSPSTRSEASTCSRKSINIHDRDYIEDGYRFTRSRSLSSERKRRQETMGKQLVLDRYKNQSSPNIRSRLAPAEYSAMQERMKKSVETFLIRQTIAKNLAPPAPGSYAYATLDFLSLQPKRKSSTPPPGTTLLSPEATLRSRSPGSHGHHFSQLPRFHDESKEIGEKMFRRLDYGFLDDDALDGSGEQKLSSTPSRMAAIYRAARLLIASPSTYREGKGAAMDEARGTSIAERVRNRSPDRFRMRDRPTRDHDAEEKDIDAETVVRTPAEPPSSISNPLRNAIQQQQSQPRNSARRASSLL